MFCLLPLFIMYLSHSLFLEKSEYDLKVINPKLKYMQSQRPEALEIGSVTKIFLEVYMDESH